MTNKEYGQSEANMTSVINTFILNKYFADLIPKKIVVTLELLLDFIKVAKDAIFRDGRLLEISIWNAIRWWRFAKVAHSFVKTIIDVWKEAKQADTAGV